MARKKNKTTSKSQPKAITAIEPLIVEQQVEDCKVCSGDCQIVGTAGDTEYAGTTPDGLPYSLIRRWYVKCQGCGQRRIDRQYQ